MARRRDPGPGPDELDADLVTEPLALAPAELAVTDELDLHTFAPRECADLVAEYLRAAQAAGLARVRIIHGKGTGALRRLVHAVLERHPAVTGYRLADERAGSWGATLVELGRASPDRTDP
jgi:DNA-nicking Smr family endonuclease